MNATKVTCLYCGEETFLAEDLPEIDFAMQEERRCESCDAHGSILISWVTQIPDQLYALDRRSFTRYYLALWSFLGRLAEAEYPTLAMSHQVRRFDDRLGALSARTEHALALRCLYRGNDERSEEMEKELASMRAEQEGLLSERATFREKEVKLLSEQRDFATRYWLDNMQHTTWALLGALMISTLEVNRGGAVRVAHGHHKTICRDALENGLPVSSANIERYTQQYAMPDNQTFAYGEDGWKTIVVESANLSDLAKHFTEALDKHVGTAYEVVRFVISSAQGDNKRVRAIAIARRWQDISDDIPF